MRIRITALVACVGVGLLAGTLVAKAEPMTLTSTSFKDGQKLDTKYGGNLSRFPGCVGQNISPQLSWSNAPEGTKSFAILFRDPEALAPAGVVHWLAYGIPANVTSFAEGDLAKESDKFVGGKSTMGVGTYVGPCPPAGIGAHHYTFVLMATDLEPGALKPGMTLDELVPEMKGHVKGSVGLVGLYGHP
ncbi:MAG: YbhB/YbcL family Raf kinase inhibitor-like protein [Xanthobacteraceae bacterium]